MARLWPLWCALGFVAVFVIAPLALLLAQTALDDGGFSLDAYRQILAEPNDRRQLLASLLLATTATAVACALGFGHAWCTYRTDVPLGRWLGPLGVAPLVLPPILIAMGFADLADVAGFWPCAVLLGICYAPFVAVMTARGLRSVDGRSYEAALLARGRGPADRMLLRMVLPEVAAGCLFAFLFVISEHGVPEFLTVKGKTWHTYAEGIFARWTRRATGVEHADLMSPIVTAVPLVCIILVALAAALRLRAHTTVGGDFRPLPLRRFGAARAPALGWCLLYLGAGVGLPLVVMARWAAGSTAAAPMSIDTLRASFRGALAEDGTDLAYTAAIAAAAALTVALVALPLARRAARGVRGIEALSALPLAVPAVVLAIGMVALFNNPTAARVYAVTGDFYDSWGILVAAYAARLLPFGVLTLAHAQRRLAPSLEDAARLTGRGRWAIARRIHLPLVAPALASMACLVFILGMRELDTAVVLPAGNGTVPRRLSNIVHFGGEEAGGALALLALGVAILVPAVVVVVTGRKLQSLS